MYKYLIHFLLLCQYRHFLSAALSPGEAGLALLVSRGRMILPRAVQKVFFGAALSPGEAGLALLKSRERIILSRAVYEKYYPLYVFVSRAY